MEHPVETASTIPTVNVPSLSEFRLKPGRHIYRVENGDLPIQIYAKFTKSRRPLMVFGQGMVDRSQFQLPRFQRMNWQDDFMENIIVLNDPTLYLADNLNLGWMVGNKDNHVLMSIIELIRKIRNQILIEDRNILFFGTSAGGFTSLMMSLHFDNCAVVVNNPQTNILKFTRGGVQRLFSLAFPGMARNEIEKNYISRLSYVHNLSQGEKSPPRLYYLQNIEDDDHYRDQLLPLLDILRVAKHRAGETYMDRNLIVDLYYDSKQLHNPVRLDRIKACMQIARKWIAISPSS